MKRLLAVASVTAFSALALSGCGTLDTVGSWFGVGSGPAPKPEPLAPVTNSIDVTRAWTASIGKSGAYVLSPDSDGSVVYAAASGGRVARYKLNSGQADWQIETGKTLSAGVGAGAGLAVVGTPKGEVLAFRAQDGQPAWQAALPGEILARPLVYGDAVFVRAGDGRVYKLDARNGKILWTYSRIQPALLLREPGGIAADTQAVFVGHAGGKLTALAQGNGAPLWEASVAVPRGATELERIADVVGSPILDGPAVCAAAYQGRIACFERGSGRLLWAREFSAQRSVAIDDANLYAVDSQAIVQAFQRERGTSPWKQEKLKLRQLSTPLALNDSLVIVGDEEGNVHLLRRGDGAFAARVATDGGAIRGEVVALKQGFIVQTANGGLYAFRLGR